MEPTVAMEMFDIPLASTSGCCGLSFFKFTTFKTGNYKRGLPVDVLHLLTPLFLNPEIRVLIQFEVNASVNVL